MSLSHFEARVDRGKGLEGLIELGLGLGKGAAGLGDPAYGSLGTSDSVSELDVPGEFQPLERQVSRLLDAPAKREASAR